MTSRIRPRRLVALAAAAGAAALSLSAVAVPAQAATFPPQFEAAQVGLTYTVYAPAKPQGLSLTKFELIQCGPKQLGQDEQIVATYGGKKHIQIFESYHPCEDGPWPIAQVKKFQINGATAHLFAGCGTPQSCKDAVVGDVKTQGGYLTVTLNGVPKSKNNPGLDSTYVEMYSQGITAKKLTKFAKSMQIPS